MFIKNFYVLFKKEQFRLSGFKPDNTDCEFLNDFKISDIDQPRGGDTLGISGWGCAAGTLEPLTYTRASSAEFCYPILE